MTSIPCLNIRPGRRDVDEFGYALDIAEKRRQDELIKMEVGDSTDLANYMKKLDEEQQP